MCKWYISVGNITEDVFAHFKCVLELDYMRSLFFQVAPPSSEGSVDESSHTTNIEGAPEFVTKGGELVFFFFLLYLAPW